MAVLHVHEPKEWEASWTRFLVGVTYSREGAFLGQKNATISPNIAHCSKSVTDSSLPLTSHPMTRLHAIQRGGLTLSAL